MKQGLPWYKREPAAYLGGTVGLTTKQHAVYPIILDLIYAHGGSVNNDPKWISGWFSDMGPAAVRNVILQLVALGKLVDHEGQLTQKRVKNQSETEVKPTENLSKTEVKPEEKGEYLEGPNNETNDLAETTKSTLRLDKDKSIKKEEGIAVIEEAVDVFNGIARECGIPEQQRKPKGSTLTHLKARLKENSIEGWRDVCQSIPSQGFLSGHNNRGWVLKFSWFVKLENFEKVANKEYINGSENSKTNGYHPDNATQSALKGLSEAIFERSGGRQPTNGYGGDSQGGGEPPPAIEGNAETLDT